MERTYTLNGYDFWISETSSVFLLQRHGKHKANKLTAEGIEAAKNVGLALKQAGIEKFDGVLSSPEPRAVETAIKTMQGMGNSSALIDTDRRLGSLAQTSLACRAAEFVATAKEQDITIERFLLDSTDSSIRDVLRQGGKNGADLLENEARDRLGQFTLVTSHGAARLEWVHTAIANFAFTDQTYSFAENECALLMFDDYDSEAHAFKYINTCYLGQLVPAPIAHDDLSDFPPGIAPQEEARTATS